MQITILGINDKKPVFAPVIQELILSCKHFAGGKRHFELVEGLLPANALWTNITVPLNNFFEAIEKESYWVVFASGDPLFFGIGNTLEKRFPEAEITIYPDFNSLQLLAHKFKLNYGEYQTISLTGRAWDEFDKALLMGAEKIALLTDRKKTPVEIAQRMVQYNYTNYKVYYGECLGGNKELTRNLNVKDVLQMPFKHPNCMFLEKINHAIPQKSIPEQNFITLSGRPNMITKQAYRLVILSQLELHNKMVFWDVGACTGSISIEARLHYPHLHICAFEIRENCKAIIQSNMKKFQTPGIHTYINNFLHVGKSKLKKPDAVFIGGHGNQLEQILDETHLYIEDNGLIGINAVKEDSRKRFEQWCTQNNYSIKSLQKLSLDNYNPLHIMVAKKEIK